MLLIERGERAITGKRVVSKVKLESAKMLPDNQEVGVGNKARKHSTTSRTSKEQRLPPPFGKWPYQAE